VPAEAAGIKTPALISKGWFFYLYALPDSGVSITWDEFSPPGKGKNPEHQVFVRTENEQLKTKNQLLRDCYFNGLTLG
jgi:hypothetical protein